MPIKHLHKIPVKAGPEAMALRDMMDAICEADAKPVKSPDEMDDIIVDLHLVFTRTTLLKADAVLKRLESNRASIAYAITRSPVQFLKLADTLKLRSGTRYVIMELHSKL